MAWKTNCSEPKKAKHGDPNLEKKGLARNVVCSGKQKVQELDFTQYAHDVQAVLINPPWNCSNPLMGYEDNRGSKPQQKISIDDFVNNFKLPTSVMKDGLLFIWVEKEIIQPIIKCLEA